jgi:radical SAM protein with 4Fe4S-binding SPASM domain
MFRKKGEMDVDKLIEFWRINHPRMWSQRLKIMGGEPTLHPRILEVIHKGCLYFEGVDLFTNGTRMEKIASDPLVIKYHLTNFKIVYIINGYIFNPKNLEKVLPFLRKIMLHFVIPEDEKGMNEICDKILGLSSNKLYHIIISPNTQVNLFDNKTLEKYRKIWLKAIKKVVPILMRSGTSFNYDHVFPICFYTQEMLDELHKIPIQDYTKKLDAIHGDQITCCCEVQMGLIQTNFDLHFCNQTDLKIGSILNEDGSPKLMDDIQKMLLPFSKKKTDCIRNISPKCRECPVVSSCKVGCYYTTLVRNFTSDRTAANKIEGELYEK